MAESLDTLVADADRATAADEMRQHYDSGRLTLDEFESRLDEVHAARTRGDLEHAFRQLPRTEPPVSLRLRDRRWSSLALQYALINLVCHPRLGLLGSADQRLLAEVGPPRDADHVLPPPRAGARAGAGRRGGAASASRAWRTNTTPRSGTSSARAWLCRGIPRRRASTGGSRCRTGAGRGVGARHGGPRAAARDRAPHQEHHCGQGLVPIRRLASCLRTSTGGSRS